MMTAIRKMGTRYSGSVLSAPMTRRWTLTFASKNRSSCTSMTDRMAFEGSLNGTMLPSTVSTNVALALPGSSMSGGTWTMA